MKRKIAIISEHASPLGCVGNHADRGGQNIYVANLARQLAKKGYQVDVFTRRDHPELAEIVSLEPGIRVIHVPAGPPEHIRKEDMLPFMDSFTGFMERFFERSDHSYHLIHANFWMSGLVAMRLKRQTGIPYVVTFHALGAIRRRHQGSADEFPLERISIEKNIAEEADAVIAECWQDHEDLTGIYGINPEKIALIPCGYDPNEFWPVNKKMAKTLLGVPREDFLVLQLGRIVPRKGIDNVIRGFAGFMRSRRPSARLWIVGGNPGPGGVITGETQRLQHIVREEGQESRVHFVKSQPRKTLKYFYSAADLFITTPWYEPFGITPLEAMACATPVIGARVGGIKYSVLHGRTGWLVPSRDPREVCRAITRFHEDPELLEQYSRAAVSHVSRFTWEKVIHEMAFLYERVLAGETIRSWIYAWSFQQSRTG